MPSVPPTTTDSRFFLDKTNMLEPLCQDCTPVPRRPRNTKKSRRGGTPGGVRPRRLTLQRAPRQGRVALHLVIRRFHWQGCEPSAPRFSNRYNCTPPKGNAIALLPFSHIWYIFTWIALENLMAHVPSNHHQNLSLYLPLLPGAGVTMKTQGEIEAAICEGVSRFEQDYMGRGPRTFAPTCSAISSWSAFKAS